MRARFGFSIKRFFEQEGWASIIIQKSVCHNNIAGKETEVGMDNFGEIDTFFTL